MNARLLPCLGMAISLAISTALAQQAATPDAKPAAPEKTFVQRLSDAGVKFQTGPGTVKLGTVAEIKLPAGYAAVDASTMKEFYAATRNSMAGNEVGVVLAPDGWLLFFDYDETGYIKDEDKNDLKSDALLESMVENQEADNKSRKEQGWDEMKISGWAAEPHYNPSTNNLKWAIKLSSSADGHKAFWINESIRLLGRGGVMRVTLVTDNETFAADSKSADGLLAQQFTYVAGQRYAEFKQGDKVAEYGLAALVLGGAGAIAYKAGFLQKFWKAIVFAAVALFGAIGKLWNKITGKNPHA